MVFPNPTEAPFIPHPNVSPLFFGKLLNGVLRGIVKRWMTFHSNSRLVKSTAGPFPQHVDNTSHSEYYCTWRSVDAPAGKEIPDS